MIEILFHYGTKDSIHRQRDTHKDIVTLGLMDFVSAPIPSLPPHPGHQPRHEAKEYHKKAAARTIVPKGQAERDSLQTLSPFLQLDSPRGGLCSILP